MEMDYDFTPTTYQQLHGPSHPPPPPPPPPPQHQQQQQQQQRPQLHAAPPAGFPGQYVSHLFAQPHIPNCAPERNQAQGHQLHDVLGITGHGVGGECATGTPPTQYHSGLNSFDKGFNFPAPSGALLTPQGSDNVSSPLSFGDVGLQRSSPQYGRRSSFTESADAASAPHGFAGPALFSANNVGNGSAVTQNQKVQPQLRHSVSSASIPQQRQHAGTDDTAMSSSMVEKSVSSGEEKDDNVQSRRKAQNRAAQRAFRERKEQRVRDLEQELSQYKEKLSSVIETNELLKQQIAKVNTENEILKATSHHGRRRSRHRRHRRQSLSQRSTSSSRSSDSGSSPQMSHHSREPMETGPLRYSPMDYVAERPAPPNVCPVTGEKLLTTSDTWDLIVQTLESRGLDLDVQSIHQKLRLHMTCDGKGPVVQESRVKEAIEESILEGQGNM